MGHIIFLHYWDKSYGLYYCNDFNLSTFSTKDKEYIVADWINKTAKHNTLTYFEFCVFAADNLYNNTGIDSSGLTKCFAGFQYVELNRRDYSCKFLSLCG